MIFCDRFAWRPAHKSLSEAPDSNEPGELTRVLVGLIHAEAVDQDDPARVEKKLVKNLKWGARKNDSRTILLHSFSHLAASKADADFTAALLERSARRLEAAGYQAVQTPFGYFLDLDLQAPGRSTARIFVDIQSGD
ncbi:threonyl-tRNA synthetase editing subunit [Geothermobacter ehrlichii]|uniref:Threonyl-tRNA synthetase editing subunit n=1 Tax=Geothermobacter ehrlichii TaxID=213224 RepID=A0A5D3WL68_9BACT|nr:threonyl-tRNA synthetase editing domain-containing protein [Geothermobacter ehrlichii]TYO97614.1 threonyl-tRNA synthetase editing subunit [Geothermobacter ehrlichii]